MSSFKETYAVPRVLSHADITKYLLGLYLGLFLGLCLPSCGTTPGPQGRTGPAGNTGGSGAPGRDGGSCSVRGVIGGSLISCADGSSSLVSDGSVGPTGLQGVPGVAGIAGLAGAAGSRGEAGAAGRDGRDGVDAASSPYDIVSLVDPCGGTTLDEVLLRLRNGQVLAHYSGGTFSSQFLTILAPGLTYQTTDQLGTAACQFTLRADGSILDASNTVL